MAMARSIDASILSIKVNHETICMYEKGYSQIVSSLEQECLEGRFLLKVLSLMMENRFVVSKWTQPVGQHFLSVITYSHEPYISGSTIPRRAFALETLSARGTSFSE